MPGSRITAIEKADFSKFYFGECLTIRLYRIVRNFGRQNFGEFAKNRFWRLIFWRIDAKADRHTPNHFILAFRVQSAKFAKILSTKFLAVW